MLTAVFLVSAATLAFEVLLARLFALTQWNHLSFMVISIALFGSAASGTLFTLLAPAVGRWRSTHWSLAAILFSASLLTATAGLSRVPLDYNRLTFEPVQALYLLAVYLLLALPFFFSGGLVAGAYMAQPGRSGLIYCLSMAGSAAGALLPVLLLPFGSESNLIVTVALAPLAAPAAMLAVDGRKRRGRGAPERRLFLAALAAGALTLAAGLWLLSPGAENVRGLKTSEFKFISQVRSLPDTRVTAIAADIRGRVDRVESPHLRFAPGLSLKHAQPLPAATAVLTDGDRPVHLYGRGPAAEAFVRATLSYVGYEAAGRPASVLILLSAGGLAVPCALASGADRIRVVHPIPRVADQIRSHYGLPVSAENPRALLARSPERFDVVHVESWGASLPGADALDQEHLLTIEAFGEYLRHLAPHGVLIVPRRLRLPPADSLRLWSTAVEALRRSGAPDPEGCIFVLRAWDSSVMLVFREPPADPGRVLEIARRGNFDLVYAAGADEALANRYHVFDAPYHFREHARLEKAMRDATAGDYFSGYVLEVAPQSDRQPFPGRFLKWTRLPELYRMLGSRPHAFGWSGEVLAAVTLAEAALVSALLLLPPLRMMPRRREPVSFRVSLFFLGIGAGFILAELLFVNLGTFLLGDPVVSLTLTLAGVLLSSGIGGLWASRRPRGIGPACRAAALAIALAAAGLMWFAPHVLGLPAWARGGVLLLAVMSAGVFMGMPFPLAMQQITPSPTAKAYGWAVNGCASVVAAILSAQIATSAGFEWVLAAAAGFYGVAFLAARPTRLTAEPGHNTLRPPG
jgi:hypothetical protein